jgi:hypothetical protein
LAASDEKIIDEARRRRRRSIGVVKRDFDAGHECMIIAFAVFVSSNLKFPKSWQKLQTVFFARANCVYLTAGAVWPASVLLVSQCFH